MAFRSSVSRLLLGTMLTVMVATCSPTAAPLPSVAPEEGVTVENTTASPVEIVYEHVNDDVDVITTLEPGAAAVVGSVFDGVEAPCVTGRLIARDEAGTEVDELYFVCRGKTWAVEAS